MSQVYFLEKGSGPPLILLHGFCETHAIWERFADRLSIHFRVLVPDLPGFGKSPRLSEDFTIDDVATEMQTWLDSLEIENPILIGHSLGGYVAMAMVERQPERFPGFGLFHSTAYPDTAEKKENRNKVIDFVRTYGVQPFIDTFVPALFYQRGNPHESEIHSIASATQVETVIGYAAAMRDRLSRESLLANFPKPVLLIAGEKDSIIPYEQSSALAHLLKFPFFCGLKDTGHMGMFENELVSIKFVRDFASLALEFKA